MARLARQQWLIAVLFALAIMIVLILGYVAFVDYREMVEIQRMSRHTDDVIGASEGAKKTYDDAVLRGRMELMGMSNGQSKDSLRRETEKRLAATRQLVNDNKTQISNIEDVAEAVNGVFRRQDELAALSARNGGTLAIPIERNQDLAEAFNSADRAFSNFEEVENNLSRARHSAATEKQVHVLQLLLTLAGLTVVTMTLFGYFARAAYRRMERGASKMELAMNGEQHDSEIRTENEQLKGEVERYKKVMQETVAILDS